MKRWIQKTIVFATMLAPVSAWADIATPPDDYAHFLASQQIPSSDIFIGLFAILCIVSAITTLCFLFAVVSRIVKRKPVRSAVSWTVLWIVFFSCSFLWLLGEAKRSAAQIVTSPTYDVRSNPDADTAKRRAAFDRYCIEWYDTWEPSGLPPYMWGRRAPIMRDDAPQKVRDSHSRFLARRRAAIDAAPNGFGYGNTPEDPKVVERVREAARKAGENWKPAKSLAPKE